MRGKSHSATTSLLAIAAGILRIVTVLIAGLIPAFGQQLPVKHYNVEDGLGHSIVGAIYQDRKGYMWFGTADGLSRFDGYRFVTYTADDGLESNVVTAIAEDPQGRLWIGTTGGIARLIDDPSETPNLSQPGRRKKFIAYHVGATDNSNAVTNLFFDSGGVLWCTSDEIYRAMPDASGDLKFEKFIAHEGEPTSYRTLVDSRGRLWFGLYRKLIEYDAGQLINYGSADGLPFQKIVSRQNPTYHNQQIVSVVEHKTGRIIVATPHELFAFVPSDKSEEKRGRFQRLPLALSVDREIRSLLKDPRGSLWIGTTKGVIRYTDGNQTSRMTDSALGSDDIIAILGDRQGNLWAGTRGDGVFKWSGDFIVRYTKTEGLPEPGVGPMVESPRGSIYAGTAKSGFVEIANGLVETATHSRALSFTGAIYAILRDSRSNYWITTSEGLYRAAGPELDLRRAKRISEADGAPATSRLFGLGLYADPSGKIWCGGSGDASLYVLEPQANERSTFQRIPLEQTPQGRVLNTLHCAISDGAGEIWFGWQADLGRYKNGRLELIAPPAGMTEILPRNFFLDSRGRLWVGLADNGVLMTTDSRAEHPQFANYSNREGLANNAVWSIAEDDAGRIYVGTGKGLDRLDPATGNIHHFTEAEGIAGTSISQVLKDHLGNIWVGSSSGLAKLNPRAQRSAVDPAPVYFNHVQIAGEDFALPETGTQRIPKIELPWSRNNLLIEFVSLDFQEESRIRYQYKLEGVDQNWSTPGEQRSVNFARLSPGSYRFLVRAVNAEGRSSEQPSVMEFRISPPIWQRWWFLALVVITLCGGTFGLYRMRVGQIVAMERIRRQVATDLHDDVGSGLAQIAILSEVAKRESTPDGSGLLNEVAELARSMRESMSDIVWAVDPRKDSLSDLVLRMRQATFNLLEANGIRVEFSAPEERELERINLAPDRRRHLLLIFKETITNVARHAQATTVRVDIALAARALRLTISDDGSGFATENNHEGHGLHSLGQRATELKAQLKIDSAPGSGTTVQLTMPVR